MPQTMMFGDLQIAYDERVLAPRGWTTLQAEWAGELLADAPSGPVLELGCGAGQIGLLAVHRRPRRLICVDESPVACAYARHNASAAGLTELVEVRQRDLDAAADPGELFALVIADPPWVPSADTGSYPDDPPAAIDGGPDGLAVARTCAHVARTHLLPGGTMLIQLGSQAQAKALAEELAALTLDEIREGEGGVVARFRRA